jgi:aspartate aminotransferase-like enzyme
MVYALARQLDEILRKETLATRWARHEEMRRITWERTASYAQPMTALESASRSVTALKPNNTDGPTITARMKERGFILGGGYGDWKQDTFRIGHMGDITVQSVQAMLDVLEEVAQQ